MQFSRLLCEIFGRSRIFLPVIHPVSKRIALESIQTAVECEADGIFLINQGMSTTELLSFIPEVHREYPTLWIGVNILEASPGEALNLVRDLPIGGLWSDDAGIDETADVQPAAESVLKARMERGWDGIYFGGVAFKYQREVPFELLPAAAEKATDWVNVITSSGPGTGIPASLDKVKALRAGANQHPIAMASGISPENVGEFLPYVDAYLVASEIETARYSGVLVPERTKLLSRLIHGKQI